MKYAYHYHPITKLYVGQSEVHKIKGYDDYSLPQCALWIQPPAHDDEIEQCKVDLSSSSWIKEPKPVEVTAYNKQTLQPKQFDDKSLVPDEYTLQQPKTEFDEWVNDDFVTNNQNQYEAEKEQVNSTRKALYLSDVDPLISEAQIKRLMGEEMKAQELEQQAIAKRAEIQAGNPWPTPPTN